jgi:hypothetical protein
MIEVSLSDKQLKWCNNHAKQIVASWEKVSKVGSGTYNHNKVSSNLVGVKSEVATAIWLKRNVDNREITCNFIDFKNEDLKGDIDVSGHSVEVKGLRPHQWDEYKRCIPPKQLKSYVGDKAIVVWTTTAGDTKDFKVTLQGWNYAKDVDDNGVYRKTICDNIWLKEDSQMRDMESLIKELK